MILKWILKKWDKRVWSGSICLWGGSSSFVHGIKCGEISYPVERQLASEEALFPVKLFRNWGLNNDISRNSFWREYLRKTHNLLYDC
jgi:hypothetical protein